MYPAISMKHFLKKKDIADLGKEIGSAIEIAIKI